MNDDIAQFALDYILHTDKTIFLTGKAGTGKTTLLRKIIAQSTKKTVVAAPTGVAAINAGGSTLHSLFHLPTTTFIPSYDSVDFNIALNRNELAKHAKFNKEHRKVLEEMELLIIDEISMVRADLLDAVNFVLQFVRKKKLPFGGVQLVMIGDLLQLAPIVKDDSKVVLSSYYTSPFFFDAHVLQKMDIVAFELTKVYRQSDTDFIRLLNNIREGNLYEEDLAVLENQYQPSFQTNEKGFITLTTHNRIADEINESKLRSLSAKLLTFNAAVNGDFPASYYPTLDTLALKEGAQIMFIRNAKGENRAYYNGKIGIFEGVENEDSIRVFLLDEKKHIIVEREEWENYRYEINSDNNQIEKNVIGTFQQYPIRLAWAITIHKSQGLTFDKAIIDVGYAFAPGQVYVALSRCRSINGIVLKSRLQNKNLSPDENVLDFLQRQNFNAVNKNDYSIAKSAYEIAKIIAVFSFEKTIRYYEDMLQHWRESNIPQKEEAISLHDKILTTINEWQKTCEKFHNIINLQQNDTQLIRLRTAQGISYFTEKIYDIIVALHQHHADWSIKTKTKNYSKDIMSLCAAIWQFVNNGYALKINGMELYDGVKLSYPTQQKTENVNTEKRDTATISYELFKAGKGVDEIAQMRALSATTIYQYLEKKLVFDSSLILQLVSLEKIDMISAAIEQHPKATLRSLKEMLTDDIDWHEIRLVKTWADNKSKKYKYDEFE